MGHIEKNDGLIVPKPYAGPIFPNAEKLVGSYFLGVDEATSIVNHADISNPLTVQGAPTYNADHAVVKPLEGGVSYGFDTGIIPHLERTLITVRGVASISTGTYEVVGEAAGNFGHGQWSINSMLRAGDLATYKGVKYTGRTTTGQVFFEASTAQTLASGVHTKGYYGTGGVLGEYAAPLVPDADLAGANVWIGGTGKTTGNVGLTVPVHHVSIFNRPVPFAEIQVIYANLVSHYAALGVEVL